MAITAEAPQARTASLDAGPVTVASLARDWARRAPHQVAMREKDFGIWQEYTWDRVWNDVVDAAHALLALGVAARGPRVDPLRGQTRVGDPRPRHGRGAWHHRRALPDEPRRRGRLPARRLRRHRAPRRGPGAGRQGVRQPGDRRSAEDDHLRRATRADGVRRRAADVVGRAPRARPQAPCRAPRRRRAADGRGDRRRRDHAGVHVGHDGPAEGGDAHQRQLRVRHRAPSSGSPDRLPDGKPPGPDDMVVTYLPLCHVAERVFSTWHLVVAAASCSTSPSRSRRSPPTSARSSRRCSSPCRGSGRSCTPAC